MNERPPFEAEHNERCAIPDKPILEFYRGYFDTVYIMLHPFYKKNDQGKIVQIVSWKQFLDLVGFKDINQLDIAMRNTIGGFKKKWENKKDVESLQRTCELHDLRIPSEGSFQDTLRLDMLTSLQELGHEYMFIADEFGFERKVEYIQDMIEGKDEVTLTWGGHDNWYTIKNEILYTAHWDSHFTMLCSNRETVERILAKHPFEGFHCDEQTDIYWSCQD